MVDSYANSESYRRALEDFDAALAINPDHANAQKYACDTLLALARGYVLIAACDTLLALARRYVLIAVAQYRCIACSCYIVVAAETVWFQSLTVSVAAATNK